VTSRAHQGGLSLVEVTISAAMACILFLIVSSLSSGSERLRKSQQAQAARQVAVRAADLIVADVKEADPARLTFTPTTIRIESAAFDLAVSTVPTARVVEYFYQPISTNQGSLMRRDALRTVALLSSIEPPTAERPLLAVDLENAQMRVLQYGCKLPGAPAYRITRRIAVQG
jgi:hypothetical protein